MNKALTPIVLALVLNFLSVAQAAESSASAGANAYFSIQEPFTLTFLNQSQQKVRYLQIRVALKSDDPAIIQNAELNLPMIQDALRILFTDQNYETVSTVVGRERLQQQALEKVRQLLAEETGSDGLEQVYFTRFILQ
jgi:flagellar FliL protein